MNARFFVVLVWRYCPMLLVQSAILAKSTKFFFCFARMDEISYLIHGWRLSCPLYTSHSVSYSDPSLLMSQKEKPPIGWEKKKRNSRKVSDHNVSRHRILALKRCSLIDAVARIHIIHIARNAHTHAAGYVTQADPWSMALYCVLKGRGRCWKNKSTMWKAKWRTWGAEIDKNGRRRRCSSIQVRVDKRGTVRCTLIAHLYCALLPPQHEPNQLEIIPEYDRTGLTLTCH